jgi:hypothetical protein
LNNRVPSRWHRMDGNELQRAGPDEEAVCLDAGFAGCADVVVQAAQRLLVSGEREVADPVKAGPSAGKPGRRMSYNVKAGRCRSPRGRPRSGCHRGARVPRSAVGGRRGQRLVDLRDRRFPTCWVSSVPPDFKTRVTDAACSWVSSVPPDFKTRVTDAACSWVSSVPPDFKTRVTDAASRRPCRFGTTSIDEMSIGAKRTSTLWEQAGQPPTVR